MLFFEVFSDFSGEFLGIIRGIRGIWISKKRWQNLNLDAVALVLVLVQVLVLVLLLVVVPASTRAPSYY